MDDEKLISLVQSFENIYNKQAPGFKFPEKKKEAWLIISSKLGFPADHCLKRWRSLREQYSRECRDKIGPASSGQSTAKRWHLSDAMEFLKPHIKFRPGRSKAAPETVVIYSTDTYYDGSNEYIVPTSPLLSPKVESLEEPPLVKSIEEQPPVNFVEPVGHAKEPSKKRKKISDVDKAFCEAVTCFKELCEKEKSGPNTAVDAFGAMIIAVVNEMSAPKQNKAIKMLTELLFKIKEEPE